MFRKPRIFEFERQKMVESQIIRRGVTDPKVIAMMRSIPRHEFMPEDQWAEAYRDQPQPIGEGQTISQPYMVAYMTELLRLKGTEGVLEIGTGSGYQTAVLAGLSRWVFSMERIETLSHAARKTLDRLGFKNIEYEIGDGSLGWPEKAPFDRIIITAAVPQIPDRLIAQLSVEAGMMVLPVGPRWCQSLMRIEKNGERIRSENLTSCIFVPLIGQAGY